MSENPLVAKITQDAQKVAADIAVENEAAVEAIARETATKVASLRDAHEAALKKQHEQLELVAVSRAKQSGKIALQQAKRNQIDAIFDGVIADLVAQPAEAYTAFFAKQVSAMVPSGAKATDIFAPANRLIETEQIAEQAGLGGAVLPDDSIKAGMIVHTEDGVYDVTLNRLMREQRAELEMQIVQQVNA